MIPYNAVGVNQSTYFRTQGGCNGYGAQLWLVLYETSTSNSNSKVVGIVVGVVLGVWFIFFVIGIFGLAYYYNQQRLKKYHFDQNIQERSTAFQPHPENPQVSVPVKIENFDEEEESLDPCEIWLYLLLRPKHDSCNIVGWLFAWILIFLCLPLIGIYSSLAACVSCLLAGCFDDPDDASDYILCNLICACANICNGGCSC